MFNKDGLILKKQVRPEKDDLRRGDPMKNNIGIWIDHRKAVIVMLTEKGEEVRTLSSGILKHVRFTGGDGSEDGSTENTADRQYENRLKAFYDGVTTVVRNGSSIRIFGPGEAKLELKKRLEGAGLGKIILGVETADKLTDRQFTALVHKRMEE